MSENTFYNEEMQFNNGDGNKHGSKLKFVIPVLLAVLVLLGGLLYAYSKGLIFLSDKNRVALGLSSFVDPEQNKNQPFEKYLGGSDLAKSLKNSSQIKGDIEINELPFLKILGVKDLKGTGLNFESNYDKKSKASSLNLGLNVKGSKFINVSSYASENAFQIAVPALYKDVFFVDLSGDTKARINSSPLLSGMSQDQKDNLATGIQDYKQAFTSPSMENFKLDNYPNLKKAIMDLKNSLNVVKAENKTMKFNGKEESMKGYNVTIPKEAMVKFLRDVKVSMETDENLKKDLLDPLSRRTVAVAKGKNIVEELKEYLDKTATEIENDSQYKPLNFLLHMNSKNQAVSLDLKVPGKKADNVVKIERNGGDFLNQNGFIIIEDNNTDTKPNFKIQSVGSTVENSQKREITLSSKGNDGKEVTPATITTNINTTNGDYKMQTKLLNTKGNTQMLNITSEGKFTEVKKGKGFKLIMDSIDVNDGKSRLASLKGDITVGSDSQAPAAVEGEKLDLFKSTQDDLKRISKEIGMNAQKIMMELQKKLIQ